MNKATLTGWLRAALNRVPVPNVQLLLGTLIASGVLQLILASVVRALENH